MTRFHFLLNIIFNHKTVYFLYNRCCFVANNCRWNLRSHWILFVYLNSSQKTKKSVYRIWFHGIFNFVTQLLQRIFFCVGSIIIVRWQNLNHPYFFYVVVCKLQIWWKKKFIFLKVNFSFFVLKGIIDNIQINVEVCFSLPVISYSHFPH